MPGAPLRTALYEPSATDFAPITKLFVVSNDVPPSFATFRRRVSAIFTPPLDSYSPCDSSSRAAVNGCPSRVPADVVTGSSFAPGFAGIRHRVNPGSIPSASAALPSFSVRK